MPPIASMLDYMDEVSDNIKRERNHSSASDEVEFY
jgi:hypothetical protein